MASPEGVFVDLADPRRAMVDAGWGGANPDRSPREKRAGDHPIVAALKRHGMMNDDELSGHTPGHEEGRIAGSPKKKKAKRRGGATAASIARQSARLGKANAATAEAEQAEADARGARQNEADIYRAIEIKKREIKELVSDGKKTKALATKYAAKARALRARATKLARSK